MLLHTILKTPKSALVQLHPSSYYFQWKFWLKRTLNSAGHAQLFLATKWTQQLFMYSYRGIYSGKESILQKRATWALIRPDRTSIKTYWEVWGCCCWAHRCFLRPTCQRCSPSTSPFCPCGRFSDGDASDADSSWARARRCKRCGDLQQKQNSWSIIWHYILTNPDCCNASRLHSWDLKYVLNT